MALPMAYRYEVARLQLNRIPVYGFPACTDYISKSTGGESQFLDVNGSDGFNKLIDFVCKGALRDIGGAALIAEYLARQWE